MERKKKDQLKMANSIIPTVDLSPFMIADSLKLQVAGNITPVNNKKTNEIGRKKARELISSACKEYGFFQIVNHGIPVDLMNESLELAKTFFSYPEEEKLKCKAGPDVPQPAGFNRQSVQSTDRNEYLSIFQAGSPHNVLPDNPPLFKYVLFCAAMKIDIRKLYFTSN